MFISLVRTSSPKLLSGQFRPAESISCVQLLVTPWTAACQSSQSIKSWSLLKLISIKLVMPSNHLILCHPLLLLPSILSSIRVFSIKSGIGASALASVLPMNIQDRFPLGCTGLISLQSKGLSRVSSNTTVQKNQFFGTQLSLSPTLTLIHDYWKKP